MKISTKGRYAIKMLIDLAEHKDEGFISLKDIAERQNISKKYLEQIVAFMNRAGMFNINRGYQGGYKLAKSASDYSIGEILRLTEGSFAPVSCLEQDENMCEKCSYCPTLFIWEGLNKVTSQYLDGITFQDILDHKQNFDNFDYVI